MNWQDWCSLFIGLMDHIADQVRARSRSLVSIVAAFPNLPLPIRVALVSTPVLIAALAYGAQRNQTAALQKTEVASQNGVEDWRQQLAQSDANTNAMQLALQGQVAQEPVSTAMVEQPASPLSSWSYGSAVDQMRGTTTLTALVKSDDVLTVGFLHAPIKPTLLIQKTPNRVLISVHSSGLFVCNSFAGTVAVKLDEGPVQSYSCSSPSDGESGVIFINGSAALVQRIVKAKRMLFEAEFYQRGTHVMSFDVSGLVWPLKPI